MEPGIVETVIHYTVIVGEVAIALGLVIFVHELGHFLVAKLCGVKCEKFYLGFDIYGLKLFKYQWGETEYGIGVLPLGGYVKMLGQDDNPARAYEEMQRAKLARPAAESSGAGGPSAQSDAVAGAAADGGEDFVLDPRSYLAQSVSKRMAIISAGVVMNLIFAFLFALLAYGIGVKDSPCQISGVVPGQPAWRAGLQPGDRIARIGDVPTPFFNNLAEAVTLGDYAQGLKLQIDRPGVGEFTVVVMPDNRLLKIPSIGVRGPAANSLLKENKRTGAAPVSKDSAAARAEPAFQGDDEVVSIDGVAIKTYADAARELARRTDQPLSIQVRRKAGNESTGRGARDSSTSAGEKNIATRLITIRVPAQPVRELGIVMTPGAISAIQAGSPAEGRLRVGDEILAIDGQPAGDPMTLPARLNKRAGESVVVRVRRPGASDPVDVAVELRAPLDSEWPPPLPVPGVPMSVPALGIAYPVYSKVVSVVPGGPGDAMGIKGGDEITGAALTAPAPTGFWSFQKPKSETFRFGSDAANWPVFLGVLQSLPEDWTIELTMSRGGKDEKVLISPVESTEWFNADRGIAFAPVTVIHEAGSLGEAISLGFDKTKDNVLMVYRFLRKLKERQVPASAVGGPIGIAKMAGSSASAGFSQLLMFLVMLSANLAVINFLPIPLLDGGHMVFLILEAVRRKPVSERVVVAFHYAGFVFLISLMCFVFFLDLGGRTWLWKQ